MMGVYINMEMPREGYIDVRIKCNGTASFAIADNPYFKAVEAVPIPPHGRLIDADALTKMCREMQGIEWNKKASPYSWEHAYEEFEIDIDNAPTIIPAEEVTR